MYLRPLHSQHLTQCLLDTRHSNLSNEPIQLSHLNFTIIKVHFTNENARTKNILDIFCKILLSRTKKNEDHNGNIHDYFL